MILLLIMINLKYSLKDLKKIYFLIYKEYFKSKILINLLKI